jgi:anti-sigma-K factor RskA
MSPSFEHIQELIAGYVLGTLEPEEAQELEQLMAQKPELNEEVERVQASLGLMAYAPTPVSPPLRVQSAILNEFQEFQSSQKPSPSTRAIPWRWSWALAGAAAALALGFGLDSYRLRNQDEGVIAMLQQPNTRLFALRGTGTAVKASGGIVMDLDKQDAVLSVQNLPALSGTQTYHLWAVVDGKKVICGRFQTTQGKAVEKIPLPPGLYSSVVSSLVVTAEPVVESRAPVGPEVLISVL